MSQNLFLVSCRLPATTKVFSQLEHHTEYTASSVKSIPVATLFGNVPGSIKGQYFHTIIPAALRNCKWLKKLCADSANNHVL